MSWIRYCFLFLIISVKYNIAQSDTLISYFPDTREIVIHEQRQVDSTKIFDFTPWNYGSAGGKAILDLDPPTATYNNSGFTDFSPVANFYSVSDYPIRTAVKLFYSYNGELRQKCSGILVAKNYILTDCHCIGDPRTDSFEFYDSLWVFPGYDEGDENNLFGKALGIEYVTFKRNLNRFPQIDIALVKLDKELGETAGWVGMAFSTNDDFYKNSVFHKLSYPGIVDPTDSSRIFNGDTLYYNYGTLDIIYDNWLGYEIMGIPGQSGSSLIFTDNEKFYSVGPLVWGRNSRHLRINPEIFYSFQAIIDGSIAEVARLSNSLSEFKLYQNYPNPFNPTTRIEYSIPSSVNGKIAKTVLVIFDQLGRKVATLVNKTQSAGSYSVEFDAANLAGGVYFYRLTSGSFIQTKKMILLK